MERNPLNYEFEPSSDARFNALLGHIHHLYEMNAANADRLLSKRPDYLAPQEEVVAYHSALMRSNDMSEFLAGLINFANTIPTPEDS